MARVICRCGETLKVSSRNLEHLLCPRCGAKVRLRRRLVARNGSSPPSDGYTRFHCPCGRRLKVRSDEHIKAGRCPDCGRVVPVPVSASEGEITYARNISQGSTGRFEPEIRTAELEPADLQRLAQWSRTYYAAPDQANSLIEELASTPNKPIGSLPPLTSDIRDIPSAVRLEAGFRVCSSCGMPLHIIATVCRSCGASTPK